MIFIYMFINNRRLRFWNQKPDGFLRIKICVRGICKQYFRSRLSTEAAKSENHLFNIYGFQKHRPLFSGDNRIAPSAEFGQSV